MATNQQILIRNEEISKLQKRIANPDNKRTTLFEEDIQEAFQALSEAKISGKEKLLGPRDPEQAKKTAKYRAALAIEFLEELKRKPWYGPEVKTEAKKETKTEQKPTTAPQTTVTPTQTGTGIPTQKLPEDERPTVSLEETDTRHVGQPKPATGETTRLNRDTIAFPETAEPAEGKTIVQSKTGQTIRQTSPSSDDQYVRYTPPAVAVPYAAARMNVGIKKGTNLIVDPKQSQIIQDRLKTSEAEAKKRLEQIRRGDFGKRLQEEALEKEKGLYDRLRKREEKRAFINFINEQPEVAQDYNGVYEPITSAIALQQATEKHLAKQGLLDIGNNLEGDAKFRQFVDANYGKTQNDRIMEGFAPDVTPSLQQYTSAAIPVRRQVLTEYFQQNPNEKNPYAINVTNRLSSITQRFGFGKKATEKVATKATEKLASEGAKKATGTFAKKATGALAAQALGKTTTGALATALAPFLGPLAVPVAKALTWLGGKLLVPLYKFIRRHAQDLAGLGVAALGIAVLTGSTLIGGLGVGLLGLSTAGGGISLMVGSAGGAIAGFFATVGGLVLTAFIAPLIFSTIIIILLIAFIMLIMNNSGYVTPYAPELAVVRNAGSVSSLNIEVTKKALPKLEYENGPWPIHVTYEISIKALKGDITDITYNNGYTITQQPRVATPPTITLPNSSGTITATAPRTFQYTVDYTEAFKDSYVCDTFEVSGNIDGTRDTASSTACITIGKSPVIAECPSGWPVQTNAGQRYGINQGPGGAASHVVKGVDLEAVDVQLNPINRTLRQDDVAITTHKGVITNIHHWVSAGCHPELGYCPDAELGGNYITVQSVCNGVPFRSYYGHLSGFSSGLKIGDTINKGAVVGVIGNTGWALSGPHIHYMFLGLKMMSPFIPINDDSLRHCVGFAQCNTFIP